MGLAYREVGMDEELNSKFYSEMITANTGYAVSLSEALGGTYKIHSPVEKETLLLFLPCFMSI